MINLKPLTNLGMSQEEAIKLLVPLSQAADGEFQIKIRQAFSDSEWLEIAKEREKLGIKTVEGVKYLEKMYKKKTGKDFEQEMKIIFDKYVEELVKVLKMESEIEKEEK